jgi:hypothetical protein
MDLAINSSMDFKIMCLNCVIVRRGITLQLAPIYPWHTNYLKADLGERP